MAPAVPPLPFRSNLSSIPAPSRRKARSSELFGSFAGEMVNRDRFILELDGLWKLSTALVPDVIKAVSAEVEGEEQPSVDMMSMTLSTLHAAINEMLNVSDVLHRAIGLTPPTPAANARIEGIERDLGDVKQQVDRSSELLIQLHANQAKFHAAMVLQLDQIQGNWVGVFEAFFAEWRRSHT